MEDMEDKSVESISQHLDISDFKNTLPGQRNGVNRRETCPNHRELRGDPPKHFSRKIIIEPAVILIYMFHIPQGMLSGQYHYYAIGEKYNLSAWLANGDDSFNNSTGNPPSGSCGGISPHNSTAYNLQQRAQAETSIFHFYMDLCNDIPSIIILLFFGRYNIIISINAIMEITALAFQ